MKIVLICPHDEDGLDEMRDFHHGLAYIAAVLLQEEYQVEVIDAKTLLLSYREAAEMTIEKSPDVIGISAMTPDIYAASQIAHLIKKRLPEVPVVLGGAHVTALPSQTLEEFSCFDFGVIGEGEFTVLELIRHLKKNSSEPNLFQIKGIVFRDQNGKFITTEPRESIEDLNKLPFPAWELFPKGKQHNFPIFSTRGCPFRCIFCMRVFGNRVRKRNPANIMAEIEHNIAQFKSDYVWFSDDTFGLDRTSLNEILNLMIQRNLKSIMKWSANGRVGLGIHGFYQKMKQAGCMNLSFGVESGNNKILKIIKKGFNIEQVRREIRLAKKAGIMTTALYILGHPYETRRTIFQTIKLAAQLGTEEVCFGRMVPLPGTEIRLMAQRREAGYNYISSDWKQYRKYYGQPLSLQGISNWEMELWQFFAYLVFFIINFRVKDLIRFIKQHKTSFLNYLKKRIKAL